MGTPRYRGGGLLLRRLGCEVGAAPRRAGRAGSCQSFSVACRWPMARAMVRKSYLANFSAISVK